MEGVYAGFELYNFNEDPKYQDGLKRLRLTDENLDHILKLKIFYYNRYVRPIELEGYLQWVASHKDNQTQVRNDSMLELQDKCGKLCIDKDNANSDHSEGNSPEASLEQIRPPVVGRETSVSSAVTNAEPTERPSLSFAEVFRLIQAGEVVPGVQNLDIRPCHQNPTASILTRRPKPWEKSPIAP
ncbi:hypothetical protein COCON_G00174920 [Conger conger]|uniref:Uncharacterized protein n=1 Tax=Conger conger TaxID=82655 RepID=A0A9Q1D411_CONCO|nr:hypothetical protein COCON_G00174920 [Conger conger]